MNNVKNLLTPILTQLEKDGVQLDSASLESGIESFLDLIRQWNDFASLISVKDAESHLLDHCIDSLSLLPAIHEASLKAPVRYVDIGTGGGFPAFPICIASPQTPTILIERNMKKTTFLKKAVSRLKLPQVEIQNVSFDGLDLFDGITLITSRAVEKPLEVIPKILNSLNPGDRYLCQSDAIHQAVESMDSPFTVESVDDNYGLSGYRRSTLYVVTKA